MKINKKMIFREVADEYILVPAGESVISTNGLFMLTETAAFIWKILPEAADEAEIVERVKAEYDVSNEDVEKDVSDFLAYLRSYDILS